MIEAIDKYIDQSNVLQSLVNRTEFPLFTIFFDIFV